jgi:hypothetical protein
MWSFASERTLRRAMLASVIALTLMAIGFYRFQNTAQPIGGEISLVKLIWLAEAIFLWGVLPALLMADPRLSQPLRSGFAVLFALMVARGVIEGWMLYVTHNWSPWYGIGHDLVCAIGLIVTVARTASRAPLDRLVRRHAFVSAIAFLPEMYFAWFMLQHFDTTGASAIYFVPDDPRYVLVLRITTIVVVSLSAYLPYFLYRWTRPNQPASHA